MSSVIFGGSGSLGCPSVFASSFFSIEEAEPIAAFEKKLVAVLGAGEGPREAGQPGATINRVSRAIGGLYGEVDRADAVPTTAQHNAMAETEKRFSEVMTQWAALKKKDLPELNQQLRKANLPEIRLESKSAQPDESEDIE